MPASRLTYLVVYKTDSQVYGSATKDIALNTPLPTGVNLEDKRVLFIAYEPDTEELTVHPISQEEVIAANPGRKVIH